MTEPDSPEIEVGIFAIKNEVVNSALEHFSREDVQVSYVQMAPMAMYNYLLLRPSGSGHFRQSGHGCPQHRGRKYRFGRLHEISRVATVHSHRG